MISNNDVDQRFGNGAEGLEVITTAASEVYGNVIIPPFTALEIYAEASDTNVRLCRELLFDGELAERNVPSSGHIKPEEVWSSDVEDADIGGRFDVSGIVTTEPILDKTKGTIVQSHVMEYSQVDQDDILAILTSNGRSSLDSGYERPSGVRAGDDYRFTIQHLDDDAAEPMQYGIQEIRGHASAPNQWWDGSNWQATIQWIDVTGSATLAVFSDVVTLDEGSDVVKDPSDGTYVSGPAHYKIILRPKADYAAGFSHISNLGLHQSCSATKFDFRLVAGSARKIVTGPYYTRVGTFGDGAGTAHVSRLGVSE